MSSSRIVTPLLVYDGREQERRHWSRYREHGFDNERRSNRLTATTVNSETP
ncbi:hypothetical protein SESBI_12248 [Sesbania bispinosa]|nr:hypothetical protein SESBI_12248 [Sesbania bispinosa]